MTQRELTLQKYLEDINLHESVRDAIHDAMKEHAIEFAKWTYDKGYTFYNQGNSTEQLYNKFNLNQ